MPKIIDKTEARQAEHQNLRYVLLVSTIVAVVVLGSIYLWFA
ncbi:MAG: hypothetical protein R3C69_14045 [Geminicoccaceae bacterium]